MKKKYIIIILVVLATIISSLLIIKKRQNPENKSENITIETGEDKTEEIVAINPNGKNVKILGETTEKSEIKEDNREKQEDPPKITEKNQKVIFETHKLYSLINSYRKENKLSPLNANQSLEVSAKRKIEDMIENKYFRHEDVDNIESWYLFKTAGYEFETAGENLSFSINTPWQVFEAWTESSVHNDQLLNNTYIDMGISADCESYKIVFNPSCIVVLHLGSR